MTRSPKLPEVTQGRKFIDFDSDDDDDDYAGNLDNDDDDVTIKQSSNLDISGIEQICDTNTNDLLVNELNIKKSTTENLKRIKINLNRINDAPHDEPPSKIIKKNLNIDTSETINELIIMNNNETKLNYIKANGIVREMKRPQKHRGIVSTNSDQQSIPSTSSSLSSPISSSSSSASNYDRQTTLKISYRLLSNNFIQFALILYETANSNPRTRRNLAREFQKMPLQKDLNNSIGLKSNKKLSKMCQKKSSPSPLKKSLRF